MSVVSAIQYSYQSADGATSTARLLAAAGPYLPVALGTPGGPADKSVAALIETGASVSAVDRALAGELGLRLIDRRPARGSAAALLDIYLGRLVIPATGRDTLEAFVALELGPHWPLVLGRDVLTGLVMTYDGVNGIVTVSG